MEAGCELTYDYGAAGSAGGNNHEDNSHQENPISSCVGRSFDGRPEEIASHVHGLLNFSRNEEAPQAEEDGQRDGWTAGDDLSKRDETPSAPSLRRKCLCGSKNCRGLLPCNRAIL